MYKWCGDSLLAIKVVTMLITIMLDFFLQTTIMLDVFFNQLW